MPQLHESPPGADTSYGGDGGWVELIRGLTRIRAIDLAHFLARMGIAARDKIEDNWVTVLVKPAQLEEAQFVVAVVSFHDPATYDAPFAETGRRRSVELIKSALASLVGLVVIAALLALTYQLRWLGL